MVLGALESTLIQSFAGLSNIKFSELRMVKMKKKCSIIEMRMKNIHMKEPGHENNIRAPVSFIRIQYGNSMKS